MSTIEDLERKVKRLRDQLRAAEISWADALIDAHPVKVGNVIRDRRGDEYRVVSVHGSRWGRLEMRGNPRKKNGEWSKAERIIY